MLCNPYYAGKIRYRGMTVRPKGVSYRSTPPQLSEGLHEPIISQELWERCQVMRASRRRNVKTLQKTARVHLLQSLAVCANCGRRLRIQSPKKFSTYYREVSDIRGFSDCIHSGQSIHADLLDEQVALIIKSLKLAATWEQDVRKLLHQEQERPDPEAERKEIRTMLRLMRDNYERGLYEGEEYQYWQRVNGLKEKLELLNRIPEAAIERAALTLLNLHDSWECATREERKMLVRTMIQEVGCDVGAKRIVWVKVNPDYEILFRLMDRLRGDSEGRYWIRKNGAEEEFCDKGEVTVQEVTEVKIPSSMSHNALTSVEEYVQ